MIKKLRIRNFQAHKKLDIELDPNITCIVGATDTGKSAIIRAIRWACLNRPSSDQFIRTGAEFVSVQMEIDDNRIKRKRTKKENSYIINGDKEFKAIRSDVPDEISNILKVSNINFQNQHDSPFWLSLSPGEVSRQLNNIINLDRIDNLMCEATSRIRKKKIEVQLIDERIAKQRILLKQYRVIDDLNHDLKKIENLQNACDKASKDIENLENVIFKYRNNIKIVDAMKKFTSSINSLIDKIKNSIDDQNRNSEIESLISKAKRFSKESNIEIPNITKLDKLKIRYDNVKKENSALESIIELYNDSSINKKNLKIEFKKIEIDYKKLQEEKCPLCGK